LRPTTPESSRIVDQDTGTVEIEMPIPISGVPAALKKLVQVSARNEVVVPIENRHWSHWTCLRHSD